MNVQPPVIDVLGKPCPMPVITLARSLPDIEVGAVLVVLADDPGAKVDIPVWCRMKGQELVGVTEADHGWEFAVRRTS